MDSPSSAYRSSPVSSPKRVERDAQSFSSIRENHRQIVELEFLAPIQTEHFEPESILFERKKQAETIQMSKDPLYSLQLITKWGYIAPELDGHIRNHFPAKGSLLTLDEQEHFLREIQNKVVQYFIDTIRDIKNFYCYGCIAGIAVNMSNIINDLYQLKIARLQTQISDLRVYPK
jgi:hypothetical protein